MPQFAGTMQAGVGDSGPWLTANGRLIARYRGADYIRRIGREAGQLGYLVRLPDAPGWLVRIADDPAAATLPGAPTVTNPPTIIRMESQGSAYYGALPGDTTARVAIRGWVTPAAAGAQAALVTAGATGTWNALPVAANGRIDTFQMVPYGTGYQLKFRATAFQGAEQASRRFDCLPARVTVRFDPIPREAPQGTYSAYGTVSPITAPVTAALRRWDFSSTPMTINVDAAGRFTATTYLQDVGGPYWIEITATGSGQVASSPQFAVAQAIIVNAVQPATTYIPLADASAPIHLSGTFRGDATWETAELQLMVGGTPGAAVALPLIPGADGRNSFGATVNVAPGTGIQFRVRKTQNTGIFADSNAFAVIRRATVTTELEAVPYQVPPDEMALRMPGAK